MAIFTVKKITDSHLIFYSLIFPPDTNPLLQLQVHLLWLIITIITKKMCLKPIIIVLITPSFHCFFTYFVSTNDQSHVLLNLLVSLLPLPSCFHLFLLQRRALGLRCKVGLKASQGGFAFEVAESKCFISAVNAPCVIGFHGCGMSFVRISYFCML